MILHFTVGMIMTLVLKKLKVPFAKRVLIVFSVALAKEINDTQYTIDIIENIKDITFTMLPLLWRKND